MSTTLKPRLAKYGETEFVGGLTYLTTLDDLLIEESRSTAVQASGGTDVFRLQADLVNNDAAGTITLFENRGVLKSGNAGLGTLRVVPTTVPRDAGVVGALDVEEPDTALRLRKWSITPAPKAFSATFPPIFAAASPAPSGVGARWVRTTGSP